MNKEKWLIASIVLLSVSIVFSSIFVGKAILALGSYNNQVMTEKDNNSDILSFSEAADYLKISTVKLKSILEESKQIDGRCIPYYKNDNDIRFSKTALQQWIIYISENQFSF